LSINFTPANPEPIKKKVSNLYRYRGRFKEFLSTSLDLL
jgi:hypothetical protein